GRQGGIRVGRGRGLDVRNGVRPCEVFRILTDGARVPDRGRAQPSLTGEVPGDFAGKRREPRGQVRRCNGQGSSAGDSPRTPGLLPTTSPCVPWTGRHGNLPVLR